MRTLFLKICTAIVFVFAVSCTPNLVNIKKIESKIPDKFKEIEKSEKYKEFAKEHKTIRLFDKIVKKIDYDEKTGFVIETEIHNIDKILKGRKYSFHNYLNKNSEIISISARTIKPDGKIIDLSMDDIYVRSIDHYSFDHHEKTGKVKFNIKDVSDGSIVEFILRTRQYLKDEPDVSFYYYVESTSRPIMLLDYQFDIPEWMMQNNPDQMKLRYKVNATDVKFEKKTYLENAGDKRAKLKWTRTNISKKEIDSQTICRKCLRKSLKINIAKWDNWSEMSKQLYNLYQSQIVLSERVIKKARMLTAGISEDRKMILKLANYAQSLEVNYFMNNYSSKYKVTDSEIVLRRHYGTPKDISILLISLLRSAGFKKSYPVLVRDLSDLPFDKDLMINSFSDVLIYVETADGRKYWIDPTYYKSDLNIISEDSENRTGLILSDDALNSFIVTPKPESENNRKDYSVKFNIDTSMKVKTDVEAVYSGQRAYRKRYSIANSNRKERLVKAASMLNDGYFNGMISPEGKVFDVKYQGVEGIGKEVKLSFAADIDVFRKSRYDDSYILDMVPFDSDSLFDIPPFKHKKRKDPVMWKKRRNSSVTASIRYPAEKLELISFPKMHEVIFDKKDFFIRCSVVKNEPGLFIYKIEFKRDIRKVSVSDFSKAQDVYRELTKLFNSRLVFKKK